MSSPLRVFQVASGNVGTEMIKRIQKHPDLELVGLHCYSPDKVGRDVGEIAGIGPIGVPLPAPSTRSWPRVRIA